MDAKIMALRVEKWLPIFEAQAKSGLSKNEWCRRNGIRQWEFYERQRDCRTFLLEKADKSEEITTLPGDSTSFVEIPLEPYRGADTASMPGQKKDNHIGITCGRFTITLEGEIDKEALSVLIREVANVQ